jgi:hypothetical protein
MRCGGCACPVPGTVIRGPFGRGIGGWLAERGCEALLREPGGMRPLGGLGLDMDRPR